MNITDKILAFPLVKKGIDVSKKIHPLGFDGLSLHYVSKFLIEGAWHGSFSIRASAISFKIFLAFFPAIIVLFSLATYVVSQIGIVDFEQQLMNVMRDFFPGDTFDLFEGTVYDLLTRKHSQFISVSFILGLYYASNSMHALLEGFNSSYNLMVKRSPLRMRLYSLVLVFFIALIMITAVALLGFSDFAIQYLTDKNIVHENFQGLLIFAAKWLVPSFLFLLSISTLYNIGDPARKKWKVFSVGANMATLFFLIATFGFAFYINNFNQYNKLYGSIGTLLIMLIWVYFNAMILLLGFELNASISKAKMKLNK